MSPGFPRKYNQALNHEIESWSVQGIIAPDVSARLLQMYPPAPPESHRLVTILMNIGAVLVGLGALLFIASNWKEMTSTLKVVLIISSIIVTNFAGWRLRFEPGSHPKLGSALLLLGTFFYGGGIWLISQIFNFDTSAANGLLQWATGTAACALVTSCAPLAIVTAILVSYWSLVGTHSMLVLALPFAASLFVAYKLRSPYALAIALAGGASWIAVIGKTGEFGLIFYGCALFSTYLWHRKRWQIMSTPHLYVGLSAALLGILIATFHKPVTFSELQMSVLAPLFLCSMVMGYLANADDNKSQYEVIGCLLVSICAFMLAATSSDATRLALSNLLLLLSILALIWSGVNRLHNVGLVNLAIGFFVIDIFCRYFDLFYSMLDRSIFFIVGGALLMVAGFVAEKSRRKIIGGLA